MQAARADSDTDAAEHLIVTSPVSASHSMGVEEFHRAPSVETSTAAKTPTTLAAADPRSEHSVWDNPRMMELQMELVQALTARIKKELGGDFNRTNTYGSISDKADNIFDKVRRSVWNYINSRH